MAASYRHHKLLRLGRQLHMLLIVLYPVAVVTVMESLDCRSTGQGDGLRWWPNIYVECYGPDHTVSGVLAYSVLVLYVLGMPLTSYAILIRHANAEATMWSYYTDTSMRPDRFYYFHIMFLSTVLVAADTQLWRDRTGSPTLMWLGWGLVVGVVCGGRLGFVLARPPYAETKRWMVWPEVCVLVSLMLLRSTLLVMNVGTGDWMALLTMVALACTGLAMVVAFLTSCRFN
jgi:hypothetical protein